MLKYLILKMKESIISVLPITLIVLVLNFTIVPFPVQTLFQFIIGAILLIVGIGLFTLGSEKSMMTMGELMGSYLTRSRKIQILLPITLLLGIIITLAEPDLKVLARQAPGIPDAILVWSVAIGVGLFLVLAFLRILLQLKLSNILIILYSCVFVLAIFAPNDFIPIAFDSGGVTTGPITVPFIMALGIGMAGVRSDKTTREDSFGLISLCSVGPILAVLILGIFYQPAGGNYTEIQINENLAWFEIILEFARDIPDYMIEVISAIFPITIFFLLFQVTALKISYKKLIKIGVGLVYTYIGLVLFLTGVNVGFMPAGFYIGENLYYNGYQWLFVPLGVVIGFVIVTAEPAVHVLNRQVEEISEGAISAKAMGVSLSLGVGISVGLAMLRVLLGIPIWYFVVPGYIIAIILSFFVPPIFTSVAFDSGGVASGPMTATFLLPMTMGVCEALGKNILLEAFGVIAMVAMTPLITIQGLGILYQLQSKRVPQEELKQSEDEFIYYDVDEDYVDEDYAVKDYTDEDYEEEDTAGI